MRITVIGSGNSGLIHAAKMYEKGQQVAILKTTSKGNLDFFKKIKQAGEYEVVDETSGGRHFIVRPELITTDVKEAIDFADIIFVTTITNQHESIAQMIAPYVRDHQMIVLIPGYMGSLIFKRYINKQVVYCEWETTAYNGRIMDNSFVRITFYNPRNAISVLPLSHKDEVLATLSQLFDNTRYFRKNILESALHNPNMIVHPIGILFSVARIEYSKGEYWMYKEGYSPSVLNVIQAFDESKNAILERFGCEPLNYFEAAKWRNELSLDIDAMDSFWEFAECSNKGPSKVDCRYINEDVPMGLGLIVSLGKVLGIDVSIQQSIFTLAGALTQKDFSKGARTIQYLLGKDDVTFEDIASAIEQ
ncbi:MAG: NAD/NADP octopine/nopaline dehydrogenase family protein [Prevotella sp.]|nr:NAD/NADP octopine/nopaline dehydrogenase family protein [Prevotella sp.]